MKIIADENMSDVHEIFGPFGEVETIAGRAMTAASVASADVLLVRSVTKVDGQLLEGSRAKFVGSATIGTDHIDLGYLQEKGIHFAHAPGCNAEAVVQYMFSVFCTLEAEWRHKNIGIIGCGNVGGRLFKHLTTLGVACQVYDPFLNASKCASLADLQTVLSADIICLHTPLTRDGEFPTEHMINRQVLEQCIRPGALLINAGRGAAIDNGALLAHLQGGADLNVVLDVWEGEPDINRELLQVVDLGTPHIAGYSLEGRLRGTQMVRDGMCRHLGLAVEGSMDDLLTGEPAGLDGLISLAQGAGLDEAILAAYSIAKDDRQMRSVLNGSDAESSKDVGTRFDGLRKHYAQRREFSHYRVSGVGEQACRAELELLGFHSD